VRAVWLFQAKLLQVAQKTRTATVHRRNCHQIVIEKRGELKRTGILKTYHLIKQELIKQNIKIGRDKLADILRDNNLLVKRKRSYTKTTITNKWRNIYDDLRVDFTPTASEQLWCADITYIRTNKGFEYLSLITDEYSKYIVGWCSFPSLHTTGCYKALQMALQQCHYPQRKLVHHSDRGVQYCSHKYTTKLIQHDCLISVTQNGSPYENPVAESMNAILKTEMGLDKTFKSRTEARKNIEEKCGYTTTNAFMEV
jgi:putative transposase